MLVGDFHLVGVALDPDEANAELIIHSDTVLTGAIASERLQPVARRHAEIGQ